MTKQSKNLDCKVVNECKRCHLKAKRESCTLSCARSWQQECVWIEHPQL